MIETFDLAINYSIKMVFAISTSNIMIEGVYQLRSNRICVA